MHETNPACHVSLHYPNVGRDLHSLGGHMALFWSRSILIYQGVYCCTKVCTSTLMTASLKVVTIECIERDVTCLIGRVSYA